MVHCVSRQILLDEVIIDKNFHSYYSSVYWFIAQIVRLVHSHLYATQMESTYYVFWFSWIIIGVCVTELSFCVGLYCHSKNIRSHLHKEFYSSIISWLEDVVDKCTYLYFRESLRRQWCDHTRLLSEFSRAIFLFQKTAGYYYWWILNSNWQ